MYSSIIRTWGVVLLITTGALLGSGWLGSSPASADLGQFDPECPPWKSTDDWHGVTTQCMGDPPVDCLKRPRLTNMQVILCGYSSGEKWAAVSIGWHCGIADWLDCYPIPCKRAVLLAEAFYGSYNDFVSRVPIPIQSAGVPQAMIVEEISNLVMADIFWNLYYSADQNIGFTCGRNTWLNYDQKRDEIDQSTRPHLSVSFGSSILFRGSNTALKARKYADLIGRAITLQAIRRDGYGYAKTLPLKFAFGPGLVKKVNSRMSISPTGGISLRITL